MKDVGENGYTYVGQDNGEAIFVKDGRLYREKDHQYLVKISEKEEDRFAKRKVKFQNF